MLASHSGFDRDPRIVRARRVSNGFSYETWLVDILQDTDLTTIVVRREPLSGPLAPYDVLRESVILNAVTHSGVPAPQVLAAVEDSDVLGSPFVVMQFVNGDVPDYRSLPDDPRWSTEASRREMAEQFLSVLAAVHRVPWRGTPLESVLGASLTDPPIKGSIGSIQSRLAALTGSRWRLPAAFIDAGRWLDTNAPPLQVADAVLVHGDYKVGNFIWRDGQIRALLDWEMAAIGDPLMDLGYACHPIMRSRNPELMAGLLPVDEFISIYEHHSGLKVDRRRLDYFIIFALYFHEYTALSSVMTLADNGGDFRMSALYSKVSQATRHIVERIERYEGGLRC